MKRKISLLLCLLLIFTAIPVYAENLSNTGYVQDSNGTSYNILVPRLTRSGGSLSLRPFASSDNATLSLSGYTKGDSTEIDLRYVDIAKWLVSLSADAEPDYNSGQPYQKSTDGANAIASLFTGFQKLGNSTYGFTIKVTPYTPDNPSKTKYVTIEMKCNNINVSGNAGKTITNTIASTSYSITQSHVTYDANRKNDPYLFYLFFGSDGQLYAYPKKYKGDDIYIDYKELFGVDNWGREVNYDAQLSMPSSLQQKVRAAINKASFSQTTSSIEWNCKTESLITGGQYNFSVKGNGSSKVYWSSSDTSVATVNDNGLVKAVKNGTATITATCNGLSIDTKLIAYPEIMWQKKKESLVAGDTSSFSIKTVGEQIPVIVNWTSSNTSVAKVNANGMVTAVSAGTATITATGFGQTLTTSITVTPRTMTWTYCPQDLYIGTAYTFAATVTPTGNITWRSSNTKVAKVSSTGVVTPVSKGNAYIYAETPGASLSKYVTVSKPSLKIDSYVSSMNVGQSIQFSVDGAPSKKPLWTSSNSQVATVSPSGTVKAISSGKVTITATGNGLSSSVKVTVYQPSLSITKSQAVFSVGDSVKFKASTSPSATIQWWSSNPNVATVSSNGTVKAVGNGTATIYASANGLTRSVKVTVYKPISISGWSVPSSLKRGNSIAPNGTISSGSRITSVKVEVRTLLGTVVDSRTVYLSTTSYNLSNMGRLLSGKKPLIGLYYYKITATDALGTTTLVNKCFTIY